MSLPNTMRAVVVEGDKTVVKSGLPLPKLEDGNLLVRPRAYAGNPTDWKHVFYKIAPQGAIIGCDIAGEIVKLGPNVDTEKFHVGDSVYGFVHGGSVTCPTNGGFAEYIALHSAAAYRSPRGLKSSDQKSIPEGPVTTFEGAASLPVSLTTAGVGLHHEFGVKLDWNAKEPQFKHPILLWGGATGVGQMFIQLAKKLNAFDKIIVVASKKHESQLKEYGADELFDYHDADVIDQIKTKYNNIEHLVDCVSTPETFQQVYKCAAENKPATVLHLTTLNINNIKEEDRRDDIKIIGTLLYKAGGKPVPFGSFTLPADPEYQRDTFKFIHFINPKVEAGEIHHIPIKVYENGLEDLPQLTEDIMKGKNSGEKLVAVVKN